MLSTLERMNLVTVINRILWLHCSLTVCVGMCITGKTTHPPIQPFIGKYNSVWHSYRDANVFDEDILELNGLRETRFSTYEYVVCMNVPSAVNRGDKFMSSCVGKSHLSAHSGLK